MGFELPMPHWIKGPLKDFAMDGLQHTVGSGVLGWYLKKENIAL